MSGEILRGSELIPSGCSCPFGCPKCTPGLSALQLRVDAMQHAAAKVLKTDDLQAWQSQVDYYIQYHKQT